MKIICVHQGWELYGSDRSFLLNLKLLQKNYSNCSLNVIIPCNGPIVQELNKITNNIRIEDIGKIESKEAKKKPFASIIKVLKASITAKKNIENADLIYINTIVPFGYIFAAMFSKKPIIIHVREIPSPLICFLFNIWFKLSNVFLIFNSKSTAKAFKMNNYKKSVTILNSVDPIKKNEISTDINKIKILLIGRMNAWKGHVFFIETFASLSQELKKKFIIRFVGDAPIGQEKYKTEILELIEKHNLNNYFEIYNFEKDPSLHFNWSDLLIVPSILPEPFGRVALEAFSNSKPVIAANHGGLTELIINNYNGWFFEPNNIKSLTTILTNIVNNKTKFNEYGENAKKSFLKNFSNKKYELKFIKFINSVKKNDLC